MSIDRKRLRLTVLAEDKRTERFFRKLLARLGFGRFRFETAPGGKGAAEAWVRLRYPAAVKALRSKNYQRSLRLVVVRDADKASVENRKAELDRTLVENGHEPRQPSEGIATPVPKRNLETWLLALLGVQGLDESSDFKARFEQEIQGEGIALHQAASAWLDVGSEAPASLRDGVDEMKRLG